jgi:hypothetical protein
LRRTAFTVAVLLGFCLVMEVVSGHWDARASAAASDGIVQIATPACGVSEFPTSATGSWVIPGGGVDVFSNSATDEGSGGDCATGTSSVYEVPAGQEWQCVEFINRLYLTKGWISTTWQGNAGSQFYDEAPASLSKQPDGSISYLGPGDVVIINVSLDGSPDGGHALVVNSYANVSSGTVNLVSQNSGWKGTSEPVVTGTLASGSVTVSGGGDGWSYSTVGVVHAPTPPAAGVDSSGDQDVVWEGLGGGMWEKTYSGGVWNSPSLLLPAGTMGSPPAIAVQASGQQDVFWRATDGNLTEIWSSSGHWNGPLNLGDGPMASAPAVGRDSSGDQFVFWEGTQRGLWEKSYSDDRWNAATLVLPAGTLASAPTLAVHANGQQDVFWKGTDQDLWEVWSVGSGRWSTPLNLGDGPLGSAPTAGVDGSGNQYVFWDGIGGGMWEKSYSSGHWNPATLVLPAGTMASPPTVAVHTDGEQDVFWKGVDGNLWETWNTGGGWASPFDLGGGTLG